MWRSDIAETQLAHTYHRFAWWVAWPLILFATFSGCARSCSTSGESAGTSTQEQVTTYGATAILAFLTATPADADKLTAIFGDLTKPSAGQQGIPLPRRTVLASFASATSKSSADGVENWLVELTAMTADGPETWQVPVRVVGGTYRPTQLPGWVPGLTAGPNITVSATAQIVACDSGDTQCTDSPVAATLKDFFTAWLTGSGDLSRVAETGKVPVFTSAPFSRVQLIEAHAGAQIPQQPKGELTVSVTVWGMNTQTVQISYTLTLTASAGRWVVSDISAVPPVREEKKGSPTAPAGP